ncbi:LSDV134 variola virus B22R-like protein [Lumpy skin disease virus]|nr:LSDV134 variola virus B22R-like protein [Lumpy skin disease virus]WNV31694.1 variola virus B22R-like protein [Lumpy skin disease virus]WNV31794.1 variola virus B22R-like protein [Lumpy skin disease virus]WNV32392.1 variola virus B22R-like protein [Lumpy skin disease virus]WNV32538.1 variola virus B22R-like protein [Lumpy skin disease virus]
MGKVLLNSLFTMLIILIYNTYCEKLVCYRKLGLYNFYNKDMRSHSSFELNTKRQDFDVLRKANAMALEQKINWTMLKEEVDDLFKKNCTDSDNTIYNGILSESITFEINHGFFNVDTEVSISKSLLYMDLGVENYTDVLESYNITISNMTTMATPTPATVMTTPLYLENKNNTNDIKVKLYMVNSSIILTFENITIVINNTCIGTSINSIYAKITSEFITVNVTTDPLSTTPPFLTKSMFDNCTLTLPVTISQEGYYTKEYNEYTGTTEPFTTYSYYSDDNMTESFTTAFSYYSDDTTTTEPFTTSNYLNDTTSEPSFTTSRYYLNSGTSNYKNISYVYNNKTGIVFVKQQNNIFKNITIQTEFKNLCNESSLETKVYAVGVPEKFNTILKNISVEKSNDSDSYFICKMIDDGGNCGIDIFMDAATNNINDELDSSKKGSSTRHARSVDHMELDPFCLHMYHGIDETIDCSLKKNNKDMSSRTNRIRRSPPDKGKKPQVPAKGNLQLMSAEEMGARPKIRKQTQDIQIGARGVDGPVSGSEEIYSQVRKELSQKLKSLVLDDNGKLTTTRLPKSTKALIGGLVDSKIETSSAASDITRQIVHQQSGDIYSLPVKNKVFGVESNRKITSPIIDVDTSSNIYANVLQKRDFKVTSPKNVDVYEKTRTDSFSDDSYFLKRSFSSSSDDTYFLKETDDSDSDIFRRSSKKDQTYSLAGKPLKKQSLRRYSSSDYETIGENIYESIREPEYALLSKPRVLNPRSHIPLPSVPKDDIPFTQQKRKVIDMICDSRSASSICNARGLDSANYRGDGNIYETTDDDFVKRENSLYARSKLEPELKDNPLYESSSDSGIVSNPYNNPKLSRRNAIKKKVLNDGYEEFVIRTDEEPSEKPNMAANTYNNNDKANNKDKNKGFSYLNNDIQKDEKNVNKIKKSKKGRTKRLTELSTDNKMNNMIKTIAISSYLSSTNSRISSIMAQANHQPKELTIVNIVTSVLSQIGGTLAMAGSGSPKAAAAGLVIQGISGLIDAATSIYFLLSGQEQPKDPAIEKFSNYASYVSRTDAGARVCMMPDSDITITLAYRHSNMNVEAEKTRGEYTDIIPSTVYYLKNSQISYTVKVTLVCPIGQLRLLEADINTYATLTREDKDGVKFYHVFGILELLSYHPNVTFTCGNEPGVIFIPFEQKLSDMQLLRISTPGEPREAEAMSSDVCDIYPLKKFYVLAGNCPFDMSRKSVAYVTCSTLLRMSTYEHEKQRWILMNPFSNGNEDNIQLFTFKKYDFSAEKDKIKLNSISHSDTICSQSDTSTCFWADAMILEDVTSCNSRIRKLSVEMSTVSEKGYNNFVLTCPYGSTPFYISNGSIISIPMNTRRTSVRFASKHNNVALISCIHNSNPAYKSDIVEVMFKQSNMSDMYLDFKYFKDRKYLFDSFSDIMPKRSKTCKRASENSNCKNYYYIKHVPEIEFKVYVAKLPMVRLGTSYSGVLNYQTLEKVNKYFSTPISISVDASTLSDVYKNQEHFWKFAMEKKRTFSSITATIFACSVVAGKVNVNMGVKGSHDYYGRSGKYIYMGSKDFASNDKIYFKFIPDKAEYRLKDTYGECEIYLDLKTRRVNVNCPELTIPQHPFDSPDVNSLCVLVATSRDHCAISEENWRSYDRTHGVGYSHEYVDAEFDSCRKSHGPTYPVDNFCFYWCAGIYWPPDYDPCASSMVLGYSPIFPENRIVHPPYIKEFGYEPGKNEYVKRELYNKLQNLYEKYNMLVLYSMNPVVEMSNGLAKSMTSEAREIFRLIANSNEMQKAKEENDMKAEKVKMEIEETLNNIYVDTLSYSESTSLLRSAISTRCCVLDGTSVYKYFDLEYYLCGNYSDYLININNVTYVKINDSLIEEDIYLVRNIPQVTCFHITLVSVNNEEQQKKFETEIVTMAFEDVLTEIFDEYDDRMVSYFDKYISDDNNNKNSKFTTNNTIAIILSFVFTAIIILISTKLIMRSRKGKYTIHNNFVIFKNNNSSSEDDNTVSLSDLDLDNNSEFLYF